jgi:hypothetical protein
MYDSSDSCSGARLDGHCVQPYLVYYRPDEHSIRLDGPQPPAVTADAFENDIQRSRQTYTGPSTFHAGRM